MEALIAVDAESVDSRDNAAIAKSLRGVDVIVPVRMLKCGDRHSRNRADSDDRFRDCTAASMVRSSPHRR